MRKIKRALQKKAAFWAALSLAALLLMPQAAEAGETRTYTGDGSLLQSIGGWATNSFSPADLANVSGNTIIVDYSSGATPNYVFGAYIVGARVSGNSVSIRSGNIGVDVYGGYSEDGNCTGNSVTINGGNVGWRVYGGYAYNGNCVGNSVFINGGLVNDVFGGITIGGVATGNIVTISGNPILTNTTLWGGGGDNVIDVWTGNTLNVKNSGMSAKGVVNFQYYNFYLPASISAGGTMLRITDGASLANSAISVSFLGGGGNLQSGDRVTLLQSGGALTTSGITTTATGIAGVARIYDFALSSDPNHLYATVSGIRQNPKTKALSEGQASTAAFLNQGADMLTGQGLQNARGASAGSGGQPAGFAAFGGSSLRYETGSHVDVNGFSLVAGAASEKETAQGILTRGLFVEHGWGSYSTYNSFSNAASVKGDGDTQYTGAGWLGRWQKKSGQYLEGSLRAGRVSNKFSSGDIGAAGTNSSFDVSALYYGLHIGVGQEIDLGNHKKRDIYAKMLWTHQNGSNAIVQGDNFRFGDVDSLRVQAGAKWLRKTNENTTLRAGLAYQYELGGQADATVNGSAVEAPSLKGGTGILEVGLTKESKDGKGPTLDFGLQGFCGKARGVAGTMQASWKF